jgi:hypothetical protein
MQAQYAGQFLMSTETECHTSIWPREGLPERVLFQLVDTMAKLAPSLPGAPGHFNGYGRFYVDLNAHLELAACECATPYQLPGIVERQQLLASRAVAKLTEQGHQILLANNNHSGLLTAATATWGAHENYLVEIRPEQFTERILPFLVTRIYGGAGGIEHPGGCFVAGARPLFMELAAGGSTTGQRAIHSMAREEHHMAADHERFRYHLILGDGHRCHFNLALQFSATALTLKAICYDTQLAGQLREFEGKDDAYWLAMLKRCNRLATPDQTPTVDPDVVRIQRIYLEAAHRFARQLRRPPEWIPRALDDWRQTLDALESMNLSWLAERLDAFAKYQFFSAVISEHSLRWRDAVRKRELMHQLALLNQSYHAFCDENSVFRMLEQSGLVQHRVSQLVQPGSEAEPFVPDTGTRADARARFIRQHAGQSTYVLDWSFAATPRFDRFLNLSGPFDTEFQNAQPEDANMAKKALEMMERLLRRRTR